MKAILCNFSMRMLKYFLKNFKFFFAHKKLKKPPSKVAQNNSNPLFSLLPELPKRPKQKNSSSNRPTVYRTEVFTNRDFKTEDLECQGLVANCYFQ